MGDCCNRERERERLTLSQKHRRPEDKRDEKRPVEREDKMFWRGEGGRATEFGWEDSVPDVKRGEKLNRYKIFPLKTLLPTSLQYAEKEGGVKESKRWKRTRRQKEDQRSKI